MPAEKHGRKIELAVEFHEQSVAHPAANAVLPVDAADRLGIKPDRTQERFVAVLEVQREVGRHLPQSGDEDDVAEFRQHVCEMLTQVALFGRQVEAPHDFLFAVRNAPGPFQ